MSTILKALRRLEREKSAQEGRPLKDEVTAAPAAGSRRGFPLLALMISAGALGLGLGASLLWLWPRENAAPELAELAKPAEAPRAPRRAGVQPAEPVVAATVPAPAAVPAPAPVPVPELPAPLPEASVASPPPPSPPPVAVISRPEPPSRVAEPEAPAPAPPEPVAAKPAPPERGSLPPYARRQARAAAEPPPPAPAEKPAAPAAKPPPPAAKVASAELPGVVVSSTVWHPQRDRRLAMVSLEGGAARELHEGDAIGSLVVSEIGPSGVVFLHEGVEVRRRVGAKN